MRIGFFTDNYWPRVDGVVISVHAMKAALERLGHEVFIICPHYPNEPKSEKNVIRVRGIDPLKFSGFTSRVAIASQRDKKRVESLGLDVVHSHTQFSAGLMAHNLAKKQGIPHVSTYHTHLNELIKYFPYSFHVGSVFATGMLTAYLKTLDPLKTYIKHIGPSQDTLGKRLDAMKRVYFKDVDVVVANSPHVLEHLRSLKLGVELAEVRNGIQLPLRQSHHKAAHKPLRLVYAARLSSEKRQDAVIEAVAELDRRGLVVQLDIAGDGPHLEYCQDLVASLNLKDRVKFHGELEPEEVSKLLSKSDVGVLASQNFDTYPLGLMEYLAAGLPVVYCDKHFEGMGSKKSAVLSNPDSFSLAEAIASIAETSDYAEMSKAAVEDSRKHSIDDRARELEAVYQSLVKD